MKVFRDREKRLKQVANGYIKRQKLRGCKKSCPWLPCHSKGLQDCTFCVCPFYPCQDLDLGDWYHFQKEGRSKKVWDCTRCSMVHHREIAEQLTVKIKQVENHLENMRLFADVKAEYIRLTRPIQLEAISVMPQIVMHSSVEKVMNA